MSEYLHSFERLEVWNDSRQLVTATYKLIGMLPTEEKYCLGAQLQRAIISVPSNIAEGMTRTSTKEQAHFIEIAFGSLMETYCQLCIAVDLQYITCKQLDDIKPQIDKVANKLSALKRSIQKRAEQTTNQRINESTNQQTK